jgi:hypothetical protein
MPSHTRPAPSAPLPPGSHLKRLPLRHMLCWAPRVQRVVGIQSALRHRHARCRKASLKVTHARLCGKAQAEGRQKLPVRTAQARADGMALGSDARGAKSDPFTPGPQRDLPTRRAHDQPARACRQLYCYQGLVLAIPMVCYLLWKVKPVPGLKRAQFPGSKRQSTTSRHGRLLASDGPRRGIRREHVEVRHIDRPTLVLHIEAMRHQLAIGKSSSILPEQKIKATVGCFPMLLGLACSECP